MNNNSKKVFISYSWDDTAHSEWVLQLSEKLLSDGIDVILDRYELKIGENLNHFMEKAIISSNVVLIILTENYKIKAENRKGGVGYEYSMINEQMYERQSEIKKFIPILRKGTKESSLPIFLKSYLYLNMVNDTEFEEKYEELIREIYDERKIQKPKLGNKPNFDEKKVGNEKSISEKRLLGLKETMDKMQQSIQNDREELLFHKNRVENSEGQLERQIRDAKINMLKERINNKQEKLKEMRNTYSILREK
jgi:hypothetical protein